MAITYSAQAGTTITSHLVTQTIGTQTGGNDQIQLTSTTAVPSGATGYGSNVGSGANGIGDVYVGRRIVLRKGTGTEEVREIIAASGSAPTLITVNRNWDTNPTSGDTADIPYEPGDIEDGGAGGGINLNAKTGLWELSNELHVTGGLELLAGQALESSDEGAVISNYIESGGRFYAGYDAGNDAYVNGAISTQFNNTNGEPSWQIQSGGRVDFYDSVFWAQLVGQQFECANGSDGRFYRCKWIYLTDELHLYDSTVVDCSAIGKGASTDIVRVDAGTTVNGLILSNVQVLDSAADTTTETIELEGVLFTAVPGYVDVRQNKTWNLIDPIWGVTTYTELTWTGTSTGNELNDRKSIKATVQKADGTLLASALVNVYEHTILADLVLELTTDANGYAESSFIYKKHATNSATTTYGGHALQAGKWLYRPFVSAQTSTANFNGVIVLSLDPNIVQTTQATAKTAGSGITWSEPTNATELVDFTTGSGTLAVGMILTFTPSGATGTIRESASGDSVAGELYLDTRNATAIANGDTFSRTGGTAGTFSGTYTNNSKQPFSISINGNSLSLQTIYDYLAAIQNETTLTATGELIWEWCRSAQTQPFYATGSSFYTEQSNSKGIYIYDVGAGTLDYLTDDAGTQWVPPTSVTLTISVKDQAGAVIQNVQTSIYVSADNTELMNADTNASGIATAAYTYTGDTPIYWRTRKSSTGTTRYKNNSGTGTITASGLTITVTMQTDSIASA